MRANYLHKILFTFCLLLCTTGTIIYAQDSASTTILGIRYFLPANKVPYIEVSTKKKIGRKFEPVKGVGIKVYLGEEAENNLLGKVITEKEGIAKVGLPASFKTAWDSLDEFKFIAIADPSKDEEPLTADITIKKAILVLDTISVDDVRTVTAQLKEKKGDQWIAVNDIEMKIGVKRIIGVLPVGEEASYTADSTGLATAEFKRDSLPGDAKGDLTLTAIVEDNDTYGNLLVEKSVPWGAVSNTKNNFWHRTLWSTGNRAPIWLLGIALSIIIGVWGTILYLIRQLYKIWKMGKVLDAGLIQKKV